jgi:hypothetical protein
MRWQKPYPEISAREIERPCLNIQKTIFDFDLEGVTLACPNF